MNTKKEVHAARIAIQLFTFVSRSMNGCRKVAWKASRCMVCVGDGELLKQLSENPSEKD